MVEGAIACTYFIVTKYFWTFLKKSITNLI
jgi:hypothetical protein